LSSIISIGGLGGSGTRAVSEVFIKADICMGGELNNSLDTLLFTLMFKRKNILLYDKLQLENSFLLFKKIITTTVPLTKKEDEFLYSLVEDRIQHDKNWLLDRYYNISKYRNKTDLWGWKEPNTHIIIDRLLEIEENLKFVYVYRNAFDMAFSENQNQLKFWGSLFFEKEYDVTPFYSLKQWIASYKRMKSIQKMFPNRVYFLSFEEFCEKPFEKVEEMFEFFNLDITIDNDIISHVNLPSSVGRYKNYSIKDVFDMNDIEYVNKIQGMY